MIKLSSVLKKNDLINADIFIHLHTTGVLIVNFHFRFENQEGMPIERAIHKARTYLRTVAIGIPKRFAINDSNFQKDGRSRWIEGEKNLFVGNLKDFVTDLLRPILSNRLKSYNPEELRDRRCISSTLIQLYKTDPICESVEKFVEFENYGRELLGVGALDRSYEARHAHYVADSFAENLSTDEEAGVFTFGLSDLMVFDSSFDEIIKRTLKQKKLNDLYSALLYNTTHYSAILEWVYLEKYIIGLYSGKLSRALARKNTSPEYMLLIQKQTMHDLIGYKTGITPYPSREEFWEKARIAHRIIDAQEKLEKKRDLATDYVIQEYTLRTNKSIQLVNIFISATATFGLMEVILSISQQGNKVFWGAITFAMFLAMLIILWGINKMFLVMSKQKD